MYHYWSVQGNLGISLLDSHSLFFISLENVLAGLEAADVQAFYVFLNDCDNLHKIPYLTSPNSSYIFQDLPAFQKGRKCVAAALLKCLPDPRITEIYSGLYYEYARVDAAEMFLSS